MCVFLHYTFYTGFFVFDFKVVTKRILYIESKVDTRLNYLITFATITINKKNMKKLLMIASCIILSIGDMYSKAYYVANDGVNTNTGLTQYLPWRTLTYAASISSPVIAGDTVYVKSGDYGAEKVVFQKGGIAGKPIVFIGYIRAIKYTPVSLVENENPFYEFISEEMPTFDGGNRASGTCFTVNQRYIVIKHFQIKNYAYGIVAGSNGYQGAGNLTLYNINTMYIGDMNASYSGQGFMLGSMSTSTCNNSTLENCMVVNSCAEGFGINGNDNSLTNCKVYCNENATTSASTDYYIIICGSYNTLTKCHVERMAGLSHAGHGISIKSNGEHVASKNTNYPWIYPQYNKVLYCTAKNMGESFCVRHRGVQNNLFYHCKATGTHTGAINSPGGEGNCIVTRDGASGNTFDGCIAENCNSGFVFLDTVEDGDEAANPTGHPGNNNKYINCLIYNCYMGVYFNNYSIASDAGDNTIANCTFYKTRYMYQASRACANMKYINNIYYGCLPVKSGAAFMGGAFASNIIPNGVNSYFKSCTFFNIQGGMPANFVANSYGSFEKDPLFVDPLNMDFHLNVLSPCKDAGMIRTDIEKDYDNQLRPNGTKNDMGVYEYNALFKK